MRFILVLFFLTSPLHAALIDTERDSFVDPNTSLEWMDFGVNKGMSYRDVELELVTGGLFEQWRLPTADEVYELWFAHIASLDGYYNYNYTYPSYRGALSDKLDIEGPDSSFESLFDIMGAKNEQYYESPYEQWVDVSLMKFEGKAGLAFIELVDREDNIGLYRDYIDLTDAPDWSSEYYYNERIERYGTLLVRNAVDVPSPPTLLLMLSALGIILIRPLRTKHQLSSIRS
ncbi:hypothetical protein D6U90_04495 [Vibrio cholerae]|nr:hypothetical protein [Vibrio cholerae]